MFREYEAVLKLKNALSGIIDVEVIHEVTLKNTSLPIHGFSFGSEDPSVPTLGIIGGIHGLERIGTEVALSFIRYLQARLPWDQTLHEELKKIRIYFVPLMNPIGMSRFSRCNHRGVDLMRNAPLHSEEASFAVGGQQFSNRLPWYQGNLSQTEAGMEPEVLALHRYMLGRMKRSSCNIILDLHSGFGVSDQIWFPFAYTRSPFPQVAQVRALKNLLDQVLPHHVYRFEPQSLHYRTHGDLWDYWWLQNQKVNSEATTFLPLTLEMGSWNWVKKNPFQIFSSLGAFNPVKLHRQERTLRRHIPFFDFLIRAIISNESWAKLGEPTKLKLETDAGSDWYRKRIV